MGLFGLLTDRLGQKGLLPKICQTYPAMMKPSTVIPYLKKIQKYLNHVAHFLSIADMIIFSPEISSFCYIKKCRCRLHFNTLFSIISSFFELLKVFLINIVVILMISEKLATPGLLEIKVFRSKGHDVIVYVYDVIGKILSCDLNHIVVAVKWPKFGKSSISLR